MPEILDPENDNGSTYAYWRGRTDARLESIDAHLVQFDTQLQTHNAKLDHIHTCLEKRTRILYMLTGGIAVLYGVLQLFRVGIKP